MPIQEPSVFALQRAVSRAKVDGVDTTETRLAREGVATTRSKDFDFNRSVNWYNEYVSRNAPLSTGWLPSPSMQSGHRLDIQGIGLYTKDSQHTLVSPIEDGSVCLWNLGAGENWDYPEAGNILSTSKPGLFGTDDVGLRNTGAITEGVSVDQARHKIYVASGGCLTEIDLNTFQSSTAFQISDADHAGLADSITALSEGGVSSHPLTIGTTTALYTYDHRLHTSEIARTSPVSICKCLGELPNLNSYPAHELDHQPFRENIVRRAQLDPRPLSVLHLSNGIQVGGHFPVILNYDRRFFPTLTSSMYTGSRICSMATLLPTDGKLSFAAAGDYKSKGSLEIYPFDSNSPAFIGTPTRNRASASSSRLLSVIPHGNRIMFSDSDGKVKWVERDGMSLVWKWSITDWSRRERSQSTSRVIHLGPIHQWPTTLNAGRSRGLFSMGTNEGDVARKMLALGDSERSEVCFWTGERVGVFGFGNKPRVGRDHDEDQSGSEVESEGEDAYTRSMNERRQGRIMRRALERQADEVRFLPAFGLR